MDMEIDLSNLGTVNTMFAALFSKLGVPIKTTVSASVLEEALNGTVTIRPLQVGSSSSSKVEKQQAHFYSVSINDQQAQDGIVIRVVSSSQSKFKEDSEKAGKVTSAGMYFLHFQVYRLDSTLNALAMAKDPESAFFKRLEGLQPCEVAELKAGTHIFAVYGQCLFLHLDDLIVVICFLGCKFLDFVLGDNFFKPASYTIEALCAKSYEETTQKLKDIEAQILSKRNELRQFESEYRKALARYQEVMNRYNQEKQNVDELLKQRDSIQSSFTTAKTVNNVSGSSSNSKSPGEDPVDESGSEEKNSRKKWFTLGGSNRKAG
ncbi:Chaperone protein dnaJ 15 [Nymphaea thermarum]|nr:Chaperone protein dnaJ 15 [Nymphaea thermarum]